MDSLRSSARLPVHLKRALRRTIGLWPLLEFRNRVFMLRGTLRWRRFEDAEVDRLGRADGIVGTEALVTTVIPTYRRPDLLTRAVRSALSQTVDDHIVMVVDDGGGLPHLPNDPRLRTASLSKNSAVLGLVRNVGIRITRSKYVAFLDDDNEWAPEHLCTAIEHLERTGADLVYTAIERHLADGTVVDKLSRDFDRSALADGENYLDINSVVLKRDPRVYFSRIPRTKATLPKEDWEFIYRSSRRLRLSHAPAVTVRYLVNPESYYTDWPADDKAN